jgi:hypothetical protein
MSLTAVFWLLVLLFGVVGGFRGWAKEMLVLFSMVLALFLIYVLETYVPGVQTALSTQEGGTQFILRALLIVLLAYFGYQSPNIPIAALGPKLARDKLQDWLLGSVLGMLNGYFVVGSLWYYLHLANYPWPDLVLPPSPDVAATMIPFLPPKVIGAPPYIFFAIGAAFVFVIIVFL